MAQHLAHGGEDVVHVFVGHGRKKREREQALEGPFRIRTQPALVAARPIVRMSVDGHVVNGDTDVLGTQRGKDRTPVNREPLDLEQDRKDVTSVTDVG